MILAVRTMKTLKKKKKRMTSIHIKMITRMNMTMKERMAVAKKKRETRVVIQLNSTVAIWNQCSLTMIRTIIIKIR